MNNKGQSLAIFIVLLPLLFLLVAFVVDTGFIFYEKNKLVNINITTLEYAKKNILSINNEKIEEIARKNDSEIEDVSVIINDNKIRIILEKKTKSIFARIVGIKSYKIKADNSITLEKRID